MPYVTGYTNSDDFPTTRGAFDRSYNVMFGALDAFVSKLNPTGSDLIYSTYLGGSGDWNMGWGIAIDGSGNVYVTGRTNSSDFPTTPGAWDTSFNGGDDVFVTKLNPKGSRLVYSTYLGGNSWEPYGTADYGNDNIVVDSSGCAYVTGTTQSSNFPTTPDAWDTSYNGGDSDIFLTKFNPKGSKLVYSTFLGGIGDDGSYGIKVDSSEFAYITGYTTSPDFPITPGAWDTNLNGKANAFVTKLNTVGTVLVYSTYFSAVSGVGIAIDAAGDSYIAGVLLGPELPVTPGAFDVIVSNIIK